MSQHPMNELEKEELIELVKINLSGALTRLESQNFRSAAIRIANALGAMSFILHGESDLAGIDKHTLLGFKLGKAADENA